MKFEDLLKDSESSKLLDIVQKEKDAEEKKHINFLKENCFQSKEEMIEYLKTGHFIKARHGYNKEGLTFVDGNIKHTYMGYNEIGMPTGYACSYYTIEEFLEADKFFSGFDYGFDPFWIKGGTPSSEDDLDI